ncbi:hypothetical protein [Domibacillus robiginosus]|nr:hypothetical protein [Domibacillus robiginosus]
MTRARYIVNQLVGRESGIYRIHAFSFCFNPFVIELDLFVSASIDLKGA